MIGMKTTKKQTFLKQKTTLELNVVQKRVWRLLD